jgi:hypothetical protein
MRAAGKKASAAALAVTPRAHQAGASLSWF